MLCHETPLVLLLHTYVDDVGEHIYNSIRSNVDGKTVLLNIFSRCMKVDLTAT